MCPPREYRPQGTRGSEFSCEDTLNWLTFSSQFRIRAQTATQKRAELSKSAGGLRKKSDLSDSAKWNLGDANQFNQILLHYQEDLVCLKELKEQETHALRELQSSMLKGVYFNCLC